MAPSCEIKINEVEDNSGYNFNYQGRAGVVISWDDSSVDDWYKARDLFKKYNVRCTFFVTNFCLLSEDEISKLRELQKDGHEIACHGFSHKDAVLYYVENGMDRYVLDEIKPAIDSMRAKGFSPSSFAYPFGSRNSETDEALLKYFRVLRGIVSGNKGNLYCWGRTRILLATAIDDSYHVPLDSIYSTMETASESKEVAVFYGHRIEEGTGTSPGNYATTYGRLEAILKKASQLKLEFFTASELDVRNEASAYSRNVKP